MWSLPVYDFELQLWRLSPTGRRRLLVLLASRVPEEVVSRTCVPFLPQASVQYHTDFPTRKSLLESDRGILSGKSND